MTPFCNLFMERPP